MLALYAKSNYPQRVRHRGMGPTSEAKPKVVRNFPFGMDGYNPKSQERRPLNLHQKTWKAAWRPTSPHAERPRVFQSAHARTGGRLMCCVTRRTLAAQRMDPRDGSSWSMAKINAALDADIIHQALLPLSSPLRVVVFFRRSPTGIEVWCCEPGKAPRVSSALEQQAARYRWENGI
jgi:hypothetical protein